MPVSVDSARAPVRGGLWLQLFSGSDGRVGYVVQANNRCRIAFRQTTRPKTNAPNPNAGCTALNRPITVITTGRTINRTSAFGPPTSNAVPATKDRIRTVQEQFRKDREHFLTERW